MTSIGNELKGAYIDPNTSRFNLTVDLEKKFTTEYYKITLGNNSFLSGKKADGEFNNFYINDGRGAWNIDRDLSNDPTQNVFTYRILALSSSYYVDLSNIFIINPKPNNNSGNKNAPPVNVTLSVMNNGVTEYYFSDIENYISEIKFRNEASY
jgi:hypothetical protein